METIKSHWFVSWPFITKLWIWLAKHNGFYYNCTYIKDLWFLYAIIPLKDKPLLKLVRGSILWVVWLERNRTCFNNTTCRSIQSVAIKIISLATFWCKSRAGNLFLQTILILCFDLKDVVQVIGTVGKEEDLATMSEDVASDGC